VNEPTVRDGDNPALQPVVAKFSALVGPTSAGSNFFSAGPIYTVPAGKRLVLEYVDVEFAIPLATNSGKGSLQLSIGDGTGPSVQHPMGITPDTMPCSLTQICGSINRSLRTYANAGASVFATAVFNATQGSTGTSILSGTLNGYL